MVKKPSTGKSRTGNESKSVKDGGDAVPESGGAADPETDDIQDTPAPVETQEAAAAPVPKPPLPDPYEHSDDDDREDGDDSRQEEEHGSPLSRKLLTALLLLMAGAGIALWGAPRLAAKLPAGLEPVARWLTPGLGSARSDIEKLRADIETRLATMSEQPDEAHIREIADQSAAAAAKQLSERLSNLSDQVTAGDMGKFGARLAAVETRLEGLATEISSLNDQLSSFEMGTGGVTAETASKIAAYKATVDGLRAEIKSLSTRQGEISHRIAEVEASAARRVEEANAALQATEHDAALKAGLAGVRAGLAAGTRFDAALADLAKAASEPMPPALVSAAAEGVPTLQSLLDAFPAAAHAAIRVSINAQAGDGTLSRLGAFVESRVATRSLTPQEGGTPDAILSRMEAALKSDDLGTVMAEAAALPSEATDAMSDWLARAKRRFAATDAFARLSAELVPSN